MLCKLFAYYLMFYLMISIFQIIMDMTTVPYDLQKLLRLATTESHEQSDVLDLAKALHRRSRYDFFFVFFFCFCSFIRILKEKINSITNILLSHFSVEDPVVSQKTFQHRKSSFRCNQSIQGFCILPFPLCQHQA